MNQPVPTILLIDDDLDVLRAVAAMLESAGFRVVRAGSAREAMGRLAATPVDCIVTDIYMADGDGFELIGAVKQRGIPVIAISGGGRQIGGHDPLEIASSLGAAAVLAKPFKGRELVETVNRVIGGRVGGRVIGQETLHGDDDGG